MTAPQEMASALRFWWHGRPQVNHALSGYFSMSANVFAKVWASPGHLAET